MQSPSNRLSRSRSSPHQHQSSSDDPSESIRKRNTTRSTESSMETSVAQKFVGPIKSYITMVSNIAANLVMISRQCLDYLSNVTASNADQDELQEADKLLLQLQEASHQLSGLEIFVASKFNNPLIRSSTDREKYFHEVHQLIQDGDHRRSLTELTVISSKLAQQLTKMGVSISHFVPRSIGDLEANTEDSASDPSLHIDPLTEPLIRDSQNEVNVGASRRLIAAPRLFDSEPRIVPLATAPEPSAINITQPTGLSNADIILNLQKELENRRKIYQNDILAEERLRTLLKIQCEQSEKSCKDLLEVQQLIKQVSELNENRDTQATVKPTSARNSYTPIIESVHKDSTPESIQKITKIIQKLLGVLESQISVLSARAEAADGDHIRNYEEQFIAGEPTRKPYLLSNLLPDYPSSTSSVSQLAAPHKGINLESMMKITAPYYGTGNPSIFKRNFAISQSNSNTKESKRESPFVYNAAMFQKEFFDPITKAKLPGYYAPGTKGVHLKIFPRTFPSDEVEGSTCSVCQGKHHLIRCPLGSAEFRRILTAKSLCPICARSHNIERCRATFRCVYCDGLHHTGGCPQKEHYRDMANYPAGAKPRGTKFYRAPKNSSQ